MEFEEPFSDVTVALTEQPPADWNKPCSEEHLTGISRLIADWRAVSPFLGLTEAEEIAILESTHSVPARKLTMLRKWKQKRGAKATYKRLCQAFTKCERTDLVDRVKKFLTESSSSADEEDCLPNSPHTNSNPLTSYATYLKELYSSMSHSHTSQHWSHLPRCEFIQLAMIKDDGIRRGGPEEEMIILAQQGKIETILNHKEPIELHSLFSTHQVKASLPTPERVFLIEGAPGGGKSTLALHICHQWAQGASWLARFNVVVLAYLRDEAVQNANSLADILPNNNLKTLPNVVSQLTSSSGANVLFIFDGWDEFPSELMGNSLVSSIIRLPHKLSLHRSTVLITTRPVASGNLLRIADRRVEILGFTQQQIREYIEKALNGNTEHIQKLFNHLDEHQVIEGYCYIPLHSAILVHVFLMERALPTTLHEMFCSFVLCCIVREHATHKPDTALPDMSSLDDLPDILKIKLSNLCIVAYNGVMHDKVVFYSRELQESELPSDLSSLGLLQGVEGLTLTSKCHSYNFLHLSVQELLAAYHISRMPSSEQVGVFKKLFIESSRFQPVLHYYSGFTKLINPEIRDFISSYQCDKSNFKDILPLLHCFFEAHEPSLCQLVDSKFAANITLAQYVHNPSDYLAIGYFIASLLSTSTADHDRPSVNLHLGQCDHASKLHCLKLLLNELSKYPHGEQQPTAVPRKLILYLSGCDNEVTLAEQLQVIANHLKVSSAISEFELGMNYSNDEDSLFHIAEALQTNTSLTKLSLIGEILRNIEENDSALIKILQVSKSLTHLYLYGDEKLSDSRARCLFEGLQYNTSVVDLQLCNTSITATDPNTARSLTKMLKVNKSLTHLNLSCNESFSLGAYCIFEGLQYNNCLVDLKLRDAGITATDPDSARSLTKMLQVNSSLTHLDLSSNEKLSNSGACCIFEGLQYNTSLAYLNLSHSNITATDPDTATSFIKMIQVNKSLTHLDLSYNESLTLTARCIFEGLQYNNSLTNLNLSHTGITATDPDTATSFMKMFQVNKSLTHLNLSYNKSLSFEAHCIFEGLQSNTSLVNLNLRCTGITATDPDTDTSFIKMFIINKSLTHLDFSWNESFSLGAHHIFKGLQYNTSLVDLNLSYTGITATDPDTATSFILMLQVNKSLTHLDLSLNKSFSLIAHCIFEGLQFNNSLVCLNLSHTGITATDMDTDAFIKMVKVNKSLTHLDLSFNGFPDSVCHCIKEGLQHNTSNLVELNLSKSSRPESYSHTRVHKCIMKY